uniref:Uncharacterized protein n=1 Tax=Romanomermis culicivorax TaxID=13658 RepID=A0A915I885_ROMCU
MERIVDDDDDDDQTRLEIQFENGIILLVVDFDLERTHFIFEDFNVKVEDTGIVGYKKVPMIENPYDMMQSLSELYHLNAVLMVEDENNQTKITTGHGRLIANAKSPEQDMLNANVLSNDLTYEHSMLVSEMYHLMSTIGYTMRVTTHLIPRNKLFIQLWMIDRQTKENLLGTVTIHNIDKERLEKQLTINLNVGFHFHIESDKVTLKPVPLSFTKEMKLIILQPNTTYHSKHCEGQYVKALPQDFVRCCHSVGIKMRI